MKRLLGIAITVIGMGSFIVAFSPTQAAAAERGVSQVEYIQWLARLSGDGADLTAADACIKWAQDQGLQPAAGWDAAGALTRPVLAETLCQFFKLTIQEKRADFVKKLQSQGITVPDRPLVTRQQFRKFASDLVFHSSAARTAASNPSPSVPPPPTPAPVGVKPPWVWW
jgi:hypothetical protein